jgi:hypothetical protein
LKNVFPFITYAKKTSKSVKNTQIFTSPKFQSLITCTIFLVAEEGKMEICTTDELKAMSVEEAEKYYKKLHEEHSKLL